ncbi:hypothetical protein NLG97_g5122 [Lecanicillium saksenae]|uniref:Uncharacterized protein n=1 Tax=Lecanicillium saksenae TaxID=468837 RepID=A0ACC1QTI1_9HYPO|nr:hypothetical protein NLG97_g5122 [Lecanicillium saksenae]
MYRARCRAFARSRLAGAAVCPGLSVHPGRVALFATTQRLRATKAEKKAAAKAAETEATTEEVKGLGSWTTLQEKLKQSLASATSTTENPEDANIEKPSKAQAKKAAAKTEKPAKKKTKRPKEPVAYEVVKPKKLELQPIEQETSDIPKLSYGLDRVLFNSGVYQMQDTRTNVYNFDPYLASIMPVDEFDYEALKEYVTSSKDTKLKDLAKQHGKKYSGSTSSMTSILSHLHFLVSGWRPPNFDQLSRGWTLASTNYTILTRGPVATFIKWKDGVYSIDSDKEYDNDNVLSMLGKSMEKLLTLPKEEFEKYKKTKSYQLTEEEKNADEAYHYTTFGDFMMRSQLDAHDPRLPGTGVFDLKTRAVVTVRMDVTDHEKGAGYEIRNQFGQWESFEREYYDLIRSAFLKYSLQVRMGRMDGIFVAYHNTQRIFGFQYIPLSEMDYAIHGQSDTTLGDQEFKASLSILNNLLDRATKKFPGRSLRLHVETRPTDDPITYFFVQPVTDEEMQAIQESKKKSVDELKEELHDLSCQERAAETAAEIAKEAATMDQSQETKEIQSTEDESAEDESDQEIQNEIAWQEVMDRVSEAVDSESLGIRSVRDAVQEALTHSGLLEGKTEDESAKHVDSLVAALTAHSKESKELQSGSEEEPAESQSNGETPLKDLILRVTKGIDENTANLNEFQRMFAGLSEQPTEGENVEADAEETESTDDAAKDENPPREIFGMYVTVRNKVDGKFMPRPTQLGPKNYWEVQYAVSEISQERARRLYKQIKARRRKILNTNAEMRTKSWHRMFAGSLPALSKRGEEYRAERAKEEEKSGIRVAWDRDS